jgi:hypothetical protein
VFELFENNYKYAAVSPEATVYLETAGKNDAGRLASMYKDVKIGRDNYRQRLCPGDKKSFGSVGGMFNALSEEDIKAVLDGAGSCVLVARHGGEIVGMLWVAQSDPAFAGYAPECAEWCAGRGKSLYFRDIIVARTAVSGKIFPLLLYTCLKLGGQAGYTHALAEIYKVAYYDDGARRESGILNERSFNAALSAGGRFAGELPPKTILTDGIEVGVLPRAVVFECAPVIGVLEGRIAALDIKIRRIYEKANQNEDTQGISDGIDNKHGNCGGCRGSDYAEPAQCGG